MSTIKYDTIRDLISRIRLQAEEDELTAWEALDILDNELDQYEYEEFV